MQRRHALGQAVGNLALLAGAGAWAVTPVLPAAAETTAVKKVRCVLCCCRLDGIRMEKGRDDPRVCGSSIKCRHSDLEICVPTSNATLIQ